MYFLKHAWEQTATLVQFKERFVKASDLVGYIHCRLYPAIEENLTDSGCFDNALELLIMAGSRSLPEVIWTDLYKLKTLFCFWLFHSEN